MSSHHEVEVTCPDCGTSGPFECWSSVNAVLDPNAATKLATGELMRFTCASCGKRTRVDHPLLFHAMARQAMVQYVAGDATPDLDLRAVGGALADQIRCWCVTTANELMECARLCNDDIDLFEMLLFRALLRVQVQQGGRPCAALHYDGMDADRVHFALVEEADRAPISLSVPRAAWERHCEKLRGVGDQPGVLPATPWVPWTFETALAAYNTLAARAS